MSADRIPVSIVTGFLGSGKTTLIAALLRQPAMAGTAVVVNEFGEVGIDDAIFAETLQGGNLVLLANGCLCCTAGDDLATTLFELTRRTTLRPTRIVVETTGLADPVAILTRLMGDPRLRPSTRLDAVVATVDAVNGFAHFDRHEVAFRQSAVADRRVVTKADIAGPAAVSALTDRLVRLNPGATIAVASHGAIAADRLFGASLYDSATGRADLDRWLSLDGHRTAAHDGHHRHDDAVGTWLVEQASPLDWALLEPRLGEIVRRHGDTLFRIKGVLWTSDDPRPLVMHGVQRLFHAPVRLERWTGAPRTSIVAIGGAEGPAVVALIEEALRASIAAPRPGDAAARTHVAAARA